MTLKDLGWTPDRDLVVTVRYASGEADRLPLLARELIDVGVDVLFTGGTAATRAAATVTRTIPIVFAGVGDPVATGLVASLARPGGNVTGIATQHPDTERKRLELLRELVPQAREIGFIYNPNNPSSQLALKEAQAGAALLSLGFRAYPTADIAGIDAILSVLASRRDSAILLAIDPFFYSSRRQIVDIMARHGMPAMYGAREFVADGGLASFGPSLDEAATRAAQYVDKILRGVKPADLPVQQPTKFELVVNLKTAKTLGLTIPPSVLARADEVIQ
jgi:putative ABC transport system substrate-binding protein